ncbi:MAG: VCBS repeat-containing protein [Proteobacteria bacterium]|nr:VCBS repeat-containing protein [Pseudomonadota bacterium]MBU1596747.1 VCBS repeat-containing protein [Pseudomonadota bacterium]
MALKRLSALMLLAALLSLPALAQAQGARAYAVLPFKINGEKYQYMSKGAQTMLASRLSWPGYFEPAPQANVDRAANRFPANPAEAQSILSLVGSEFLVAGKIDFQDSQASVTLNIWDRKGKSWAKSAQVPVDGLVPVLDRLSAEVRTEVFQRPGEDAKSTERKEVRKEQLAKAPVPRNADFVVGDTGEAAVGPSGGPVMNPQFRYEGGAETPGRWQSQSLRYASVGMVVGDFQGDKKNRVVIAGTNTLYAYEFFQNTLKPLGELKLGMRIKILRLSQIDLDRDGRAELIVSAIDDPEGNAEPKAFIFTVSNGKFEPFCEPQKLYLSVVRTPPTNQPTLVGQRKGFHGPFDESGVSEMHYSGGQIQPVRLLRLPSIANTFNFTYLPEANTHKIIVLNEYSYMKVFTPDMEPQYSMEEGYNSSAAYVIIDERLPGMDMGRRETGTEELYYLPMRMIPASFDSSGKYELLVNKDISVASQIFKKFRRFSQGEVHSMFWDGVGMSLAWKTRRIKGTVVDLGLEDLRNEGKKQLVVCLNTYSGAVGMSNEKTVVVTYDLDQGK